MAEGKILLKFISSGAFSIMARGTIGFENILTQCRDCVGSRRTLGLIDVQFGGKLVKKISKSSDYDVITFAEFKSSTQCLATGLRKKYSLGKGDKVLIFANSRAEWLIAGGVNSASFT